MKVWREANQKPPLGAVVDPEHWRGQSCAGRWLFNEGMGAVGNDATGVYDTRPIAVSNDQATFNTSSNAGRPSALDNMKTMTIVAQVTPTISGQWKTLLARQYYNQSSDRGWIVQCSTDRFGLYDGTTHPVEVSVPVGPNSIIGISYRGNGTGLTSCYLNGLLVGTITNVISPAVGVYCTFGCRPQNDGTIPGKDAWSGTCRWIEIHLTAFTADQIREIYEEPYGGLLVPGFSRIFDMGGGGVPIGAIRTRFPTLTGGLRV